MFRKRRTQSSQSKQVTIEDISQQLVPITGKSRFAIVLHNLLTPEECASLIRRSEDEGFDDALIQGPDGKQILRQDVRHCGRCIIDDATLADAIYIRILNALKGRKELEEKILHAPWIRNGRSCYRDSRISAQAQQSQSQSQSQQGGGELDKSNTSRDSNGFLDSSTNSSERPSTRTSPTQQQQHQQISAVGLNERMRFLKYAPGHFFAPHQDLRFTRPPSAGPHAGETSHITVQLYLNDKFKGGTTRFLYGKRHYDVKPKTGSVLLFDHDLLHEGSKVVGGIKYSVRTDVMFTPFSFSSYTRGNEDQESARDETTTAKATAAVAVVRTDRSSSEEFSELLAGSTRVVIPES